MIALFVATLSTELRVDRVAAHPRERIAVTAFRWSWRFEYAGSAFAESGTPERPPTLYLPLGRATQIDLRSADVTHSFWVPAFLFKRDAIPGMTNVFDLRATRLGDFPGRCAAAFCGTRSRAHDVRRPGYSAGRVRQAAGERRRGAPVIAWLTATNHKNIGIMYVVATLTFFVVGGVLALLIRAQLAVPDNTLLGAHAYNQIFTLHGTAMVFLVIAPFGIGLANYLVPLQIGARDMAFPRLNATSFWLFALGGVTVFAGAATYGGAAATGWTALRSARRDHAKGRARAKICGSSGF